jgi:hypothetical protein
MSLIVLCSEHYACYVNYCKLTVIRDYDLLERVFECTDGLCTVEKGGNGRSTSCSCIY